MKVLYIINNLTIGGAERFLMDLLEELRHHPEIDYRLAILEDHFAFQEYSLDESRLVNLHYTPFSLRKQNINRNLKILIDSFSPQIIHTNLFLSEFVTAHDVRENIKYVCHGHDNMPQFLPWSFKTLFSKERFLNYIEYTYLIKHKYKKCPTYFIANSKHTETYYKRVLPPSQKENVRLIQYGFYYEKFYNPRKCFNTEKIGILNVGSYQPKKNQTFAIDIAEALRNKGVDFELNLIGHGSEFDTITNKIREKGLSDFVFQRGAQSPVQPWYKNADVYLHTAYYEPFGLVFLEAMAAGLPVVTLDGKGNRDIILNGKNGYLFEEKNADRIAEAIIALTGNKETYQAVSSFAQSYARQFDIKIKTKELLDFYQSILSS
ncbi:MAG: glycosyltransferase family 4 protein [Chitinophagales bacterium]|nr:glycosyltransferase family 4 protein [Chitinophagales bacterium]